MEELAQDGAWIPGSLLWVQGKGQLCQYVMEVGKDKQEMPPFYPGSWFLPRSVNGSLEGVGEGTTEEPHAGTDTPASGMLPRASQDETFTGTQEERKEGVASTSLD